MSLLKHIKDLFIDIRDPNRLAAVRVLFTLILLLVWSWILFF
jgi:hypothetical protein